MKTPWKHTNRNQSSDAKIQHEKPVEKETGMRNRKDRTDERRVPLLIHIDM